jgi:hypothetical protein
MDKMNLASERLQILVSEIIGVARAYVAEECEKARQSAEEATTKFVDDRLTELESRVQSLEGRLQCVAEGAPSVRKSGLLSYWAGLRRLFRRENGCPKKEPVRPSS